jgi:hypothetical protein
MKLLFSRTARRAALLLPALSLMLAPLAAQAHRPQDPDADRQQVDEQGLGGRAGIVEEFNFGPTGMDVIKQREPNSLGGGNRLLSGRFVEMKGHTLYVERDGVVVPLDISGLRLTQQPKAGQELIATYDVDQTRNVAVSLSAEVAAAQ